MCAEWESRGFLDSCEYEIRRIQESCVGQDMPKWMGNEAFHLSHRSNLTRKNPEHYKKFWDVDPTLPYVWP